MYSQANSFVNNTRKCCRTKNKAAINGYRNTVFLPGVGRYRGMWKDNRRDGFGTLFMANGMIYEGNWKSDKRHGFGLLKSQSSPFEHYNGEWKFDKRHGEGMAYLKTGIYEGEWKNNFREGLGIMWFNNASWYIGEWKTNLFDGVGVHFHDKDIYQGYFRKGVKCGEGTLYQHLTGRIQKGVWVDGNCVTSLMQTELNNQSNVSSNYPIPKVGLANPWSVIDESLRNTFKQKEQLQKVQEKLTNFKRL